MHHKPTCAELRIQVASFELKYPTCTTFYPFQKLCIEGNIWCNFVPYFEIVHHDPTCAYVRAFVRVVHLTPLRAHIRTIFMSCTCRTTNVKLLNLFTSCVPQMYIAVCIPYLRVMNGIAWFDVRTVQIFEVIHPPEARHSGPLNELCTTSPRVQNFGIQVASFEQKYLRAQLFSFSKVVHRKANT